MKLLFFIVYCLYPIWVYGQMYIGAAYYPEHYFDAKQWKKDAALMEEAGFNLVRMGDFAWYNMEPTDGDFVLDWLDCAVDTLAGHGVNTLLCTPTAAIPKWLYDKHPEIMIVGENGVRKPYGRRRHACLNNTDYRHYCSRIVETLATHYKRNKSVIGFQIDNELGTEDPYCYCSKCLKRFQQWLKVKYKTVDELNRAWGTVFWSETLHAFDQVWLPRRMDNPAAYLDYLRFYSDTVIDFVRMQRDIIKSIAPAMLVTTNVGGSGFVTTVDLYQLSEVCDVLSFDNYPVNVTLEHLYGNDVGQPFDPSMTSFAMQIIRGGSAKPIWITEAQVGRTALIQKSIVPDGFLRLWNHQQRAYGSNLSLFFPFRSFDFGHEHLMAGLVESDNVKRDKFYEAKQTVSDLYDLQKCTGNLIPVAKAAIIRDFQADWCFSNGYSFNPDIKYLREVYNYYKALRRLNIMADIVSPEKDLSAYDLIIVPYLPIVSDSLCLQIEKATRRGAVIVLTSLCGIRDADLHKNKDLVLSPLQRMAGIEVIGYEALTARKNNILTWGVETGNCSLWFDKIILDTAKELAVFSGDYFRGSPAITYNQYGQGHIYYVATVLESYLIDKLMRHITSQISIQPLIYCDNPLVDISELTDEVGNIYIYINNFSDIKQSVRLESGSFVNVLTKEVHVGKVSVEPLDFLVLRLKSD